MDGHAEQLPPEIQPQPKKHRWPRSPNAVRLPGETEDEWRRRRNRARAARDRQRHPDRFRAQYAKRRANYARKPERAPYSPRTFRRPSETEEEWRRRKNREKKLRYRQRHPERVREQKRARHARHRHEISQHRNELYEAALPRVSQDELDNLRVHIREARPENGNEIICLECGARLLRLTLHLKRYHDVTPPEYRAHWGYNRSTSLCAKEEVAKVRKEAKRRHWGERPQMVQARRRLHRSGVPRWTRGPLRAEERMNRSDRQRGKAQPTKWKRTRDGQIVTDARIALLRLQGHKVEEIALRVGMTAGSVSVRLRNIGFGGRDIVFDRGAVVTGAQVVNLCEDFNLARAEVSQLLNKHYDWASGRTSPAELGRPLSAGMARELLKLRDRLKDGPRKVSVDEVGGGRPRLLLPSERPELPRKYELLLGDLQLLWHFVKAAGRRVTLADVWDWLCDQRRRREIHTLLFWPSFFEWIEEKVLLGGAWLPSEVAIDWLSREYGAGPDTIMRIVRSSRPAASTAE